MSEAAEGSQKPEGIGTSERNGFLLSPPDLGQMPRARRWLMAAVWISPKGYVEGGLISGIGKDLQRAVFSTIAYNFSINYFPE